MIDFANSFNVLSAKTCQDLVPMNSVPFGIMITDAETRKSIVLLEPPILESKLQTMDFRRSFCLVLLPSSCGLSGEDDTSIYKL